MCRLKQRAAPRVVNVTAGDVVVLGPNENRVAIVVCPAPVGNTADPDGELRIAFGEAVNAATSFCLKFQDRPYRFNLEEWGTDIQLDVHMTSTNLLAPAVIEIYTDHPLKDAPDAKVSRR